MSHFGSWLKGEIDGLPHMSQVALAEETEISKFRINRLLAGNVDHITGVELEAIAKALHFTTWELLNWKCNCDGES